jgi:hypothetical protein
MTLYCSGVSKSTPLRVKRIILSCGMAQGRICWSDDDGAGALFLFWRRRFYRVCISVAILVVDAPAELERNRSRSEIVVTLGFFELGSYYRRKSCIHNVLTLSYRKH